MRDKVISLLPGSKGTAGLVRSSFIDDCSGCLGITTFENFMPILGFQCLQGSPCTLCDLTELCHTACSPPLLKPATKSYQLSLCCLVCAQPFLAILPSQLSCTFHPVDTKWTKCSCLNVDSTFCQHLQLYKSTRLCFKAEAYDFISICLSGAKEREENSRMLRESLFSLVIKEMNKIIRHPLSVFFF